MLVRGVHMTAGPCLHEIVTSSPKYLIRNLILGRPGLVEACHFPAREWPDKGKFFSGAPPVLGGVGGPAETI
jgi:hypothetical protein